MSDETILLIALGGIIVYLINLAIWHSVIKSSVKGGLNEQNKILEKQNKILITLLNKEGISKDELTEIFLMETKDFWPSLKNNVAQNGG